MKFKKLFSMCIVLTLLLCTPVFASEVTGETLGVITLIPPIVAISLAFITKNVILSLFLGVISGTFILSIVHNNLFTAIVNSYLDLISRILSSLADPWNAGIILQVLAIGGVVHLVGKMGGARAVAEKLIKHAKTPVSAHVITWFMGLLVFFDDYANALIVGPIMKPVFDKMKISREKLAFIVDATAAPIAGIAIISTWIGFEIGVIQDAFMAENLEITNGFNIFLQTIPYRFYNIFMLGFVLILGFTLKDFGPMKTAGDRTLAGDIGEENLKVSQEDHSGETLEEDERVEPNIWNAIIPIGTLIFCSFLSFYFSGYAAVMSGDDIASQNILTASPLSISSLQVTFGNADASVALFQSALFACIVAMAMGVAKKIFTVETAINTWVNGMKSLIVTCVILLLAWSLGSVIGDLGTSAYLANLVYKVGVPAFLLPSIIFVISSLVSFSTGTAYGTMGVIMPLAVSIAVLSGNSDYNLTIVCTSAVLTGAIFGDHCSPISDTTILSSMGSSTNHINHVRTQMPYSLFIAGVTILVGYIPAGLGVSPLIIIPAGLLVTFILLNIFGEKYE
ncbi:MAG: Na+/H+ antiporter NhaC family protein [Lachnospirales bacterium]